MAAARSPPPLRNMPRPRVGLPGACAYRATRLPVRRTQQVPGICNTTTLSFLTERQPTPRICLACLAEKKKVGGKQSNKHSYCSAGWVRTAYAPLLQDNSQARRPTHTMQYNAKDEGPPDQNTTTLDFFFLATAPPAAPPLPFAVEWPANDPK